MKHERDQNISCEQFEGLLTDYLDKTLENGVQSSVAAHALSCPLCHSLLNDVKDSLAVCHQMTDPKVSMTRLEARVLAMTMPATAMLCTDFEEHLTDYLDGFLPAALFHRWERHAALCTTCEDLPGVIVRSIAACYTYKMEEMPIPDGLHARIFNFTSRSVNAWKHQPSLIGRIGDWFSGLNFPIPIPQFAPLAMMMMLAFLMFSQTVSADGSLTGVYKRSIELAEQTYKQSAAAWNGKPVTFDQSADQDPVTGTTFVDNGDSK